MLDDGRRAGRRLAAPGEAREAVPAVAGDHVRHLRAVAPGARGALVVVGGRGENGVRPHAELRADRVDLRGQIDAPAVLRTSGVGGMVVGQDQRAPVTLVANAAQGRAEIVELRGAEAIIRDDAGVFQRPAVEGEDADERRLEGEEHAGLDLGCAEQSASLRQPLETLRAKVAQECRERRRVVAGRDHAVVIAGERENRRGIPSVGIVELVVVVAILAEVVDHIAKMEEELRHLPRVCLVEVASEFVGNLVLRVWAARVAGVADGVEDELTACLDGAHGGGPPLAESGFERESRLGQAARRWER